jgi:hypothetical protein
VIPPACGSKSTTGLRHVQALGGAVEVAGFGQHDELLELT